MTWDRWDEPGIRETASTGAGLASSRAGAIDFPGKAVGQCALPLVPEAFAPSLAYAVTPDRKRTINLGTTYAEATGRECGQGCEAAGRHPPLLRVIAGTLALADRCNISEISRNATLWCRPRLVGRGAPRTQLL